MEGSSWLGWADLTECPDEGVVVEYPLYVGTEPAVGDQSETVMSLDILHRLSSATGEAVGALPDSDGLLLEKARAAMAGVAGVDISGDDWSGLTVQAKQEAMLNDIAHAAAGLAGLTEV